MSHRSSETITETSAMADKAQDVAAAAAVLRDDHINTQLLALAGYFNLEKDVVAGAENFLHLANTTDTALLRNALRQSFALNHPHHIPPIREVNLNG